MRLHPFIPDPANLTSLTDPAPPVTEGARGSRCRYLHISRVVLNLKALGWGCGGGGGLEKLENVIAKKGSNLSTIQSRKPPIPVHNGFANLTFLASAVDNLIVPFWARSRARGIP